jgi:hypothetical protein
MTNTSNTKNTAPRWLLQNDGVDHINIFSRGRTQLGRWLSNFAKTPFVHPFYGQFTSIEGFWYYMRSEVRDDKLRYLWGFEAKKYGRELPAKWYDEFKDDILGAIYQKIIQNRELLELLVTSELPFSHYYTFQAAGASLVLINARESEWIIEGIEEIRECLKKDEIPPVWERVASRHVANIIGAKEDPPTGEQQGQS